MSREPGGAVALRFESLDALRGVLSLVVCVGHALQVFLGPTLGEDPTTHPAYFALFSAARLAVLCFFCLSGFVIATSVRQKTDATGAFALGDYALSRATRLAPPLLTAIAVAWGLATAMRALGWAVLPTGVIAARDHYATHPIDQLVALGTLCTRGDLTGGLNRPLWTLALEIRLYVAAGLIATLLSRCSSPRRLAAAAALFAYALLVAWQTLTRGWHDVGIDAICYLAFGMGWATSSLGEKATAHARTIGLAAAAALLVAAALMPIVGARDFTQTETDPLLISAECAAVVASCGLVAALSSRPVAPALSSLGRSSFTLYVVHFPVLLGLYFALVRAAPPHGPATGVALGLLASLVVAQIARALGAIVERPRAQRAWLTGALASPSARAPKALRAPRDAPARDARRATLMRGGCIVRA